jgi:mannose-1-phosphate guanylyltransferase
MALDVLLLAAGFGTRLKPLSDEIPKPLLPVCGIPLIQWRIDQLLSQAGSTGVPSSLPELGNLVINCFHLSKSITRFIADNPAASRLTAVIEPEILGTGGAIVNARRLFTTDPVLVVNGDTISDLPLLPALAFHRERSRPVTLVLSASDLHRNVFVAGDHVERISTDTVSPDAYTFTGAALFSPALLDMLPKSGYHDLRDTYINLAAKRQLGAFIISGKSPIFDIGTPQRYLDAHRECPEIHGDYLRNHPSCPFQPHHQLSGEYGYIAPDAAIARLAKIHNSVVLQGAHIGPDANIELSIVGPGVKLNRPIRETLVSRMGQVNFSNL